MIGNRSVGRALQILTLLSGKQGAKGGFTLSEISETLDIPKASVFDIVQALRGAHFVQENNRHFTIGFMAAEVGEAYQAQTDLCGVAREALMGVANRMGLSAALVLYEKGNLLYALQCRPADKVLAPAFDGGTVHLYAAASGKVMLAFMPDKQREKAFKGMKFQKFTEKTIDNRRDLEAELERVRQLGYAVDDKEYEAMLTCVSAPLYFRHKLVAAVTLSGILPDEGVVANMAEAVRETCIIIAEKLEKNRS